MPKHSRTPTKHESADSRLSPTIAIEASLNAAHTATRLKITGALPGGHSVYVIAERPDGRREEVGIVTWDGERGDIEVPFVARLIRVMDDYDSLDRVETVIDVVQDFIEDIPEPEATREGATK